MYSLDFYKTVDRFLVEITPELRPFFLAAKNINPLRIFKISEVFTTLDLKKEDVLLLYTQNADKNALTCVITSKAIHTQDSVFTLDKQTLDNTFFTSLPPLHVQAFDRLVRLFTAQKAQAKKTLHSFTEKFKDFVNQQESKTEQDFAISTDFLAILQSEAEKIQALVQDLNNHKPFSDFVNQMVQTTNRATPFTAEHIVLQDIIKVYNMLAVDSLANTDDSPCDLRIKFILAFLFEKLQGNDLISSLTITRINQFVQTKKFDQNIDIIKNATLFDLGTEYEQEFLLPLILQRMDATHFTQAATFLYRIASLIAKADDTITPQEQAILKQIQDKIQHPKQKLPGVTQTQVDAKETLEDVYQELDALIGLDAIKTAVQDLVNFLKVQKMREAQGLKTVNTALHTVFMGPPGTGKTTVARLLSKIYKHLGYLEKGHLVETDRSGMVAGYVGQTALKVEQVVKTALNGVLFIDEAYALTSGAKQDFGNEAVAVLLKKMEDHRKHLVVIVAGYPEQMQDFIATNPGLQSRFTRYFTFDHYTPEQLLAIFMLFATKNDFILTQDAKEKLLFIFEKLYQEKDDSFGNARVARNLFEKIIEYQANRVVAITPISVTILKTITEQDIPPVNKTVAQYLQFA